MIPMVAYRFIVGLQESLQDFLDASELFSIAMLVAALYISGMGIAQRQKTSEGSSKFLHQKTALYDVSSFRVQFCTPPPPAHMRG